MRIGIDPGATGAIAVLDDNNRFIEVHDMPCVILSGNSQEVNGAELAKLFRKWQKMFLTDLVVYLERVHTMPGQGAASQGNFMMSYGKIKGVLEALGIPYFLVTPQSWKRRAGLPRRKTGQDKSAFKDMSRALAQQLFPMAPLSKVKYGGRADALLIARFGESDKLL
jgi:crossover junction endodeoxyribonuclease RuvC